MKNEESRLDRLNDKDYTTVIITVCGTAVALACIAGMLIVNVARIICG